LENFDFGSINFDSIVDLVVTYGPRLLGALAVLIIGWNVIGIITGRIYSSMEKKEFDLSLKSFIRNLLGVLLKVLLIISVLGMIGIEMTVFIAIVGAAGLAVGLALSGTLQNFAGGVLILLLRPIKVGDFVEAQGYMGTIKEIQIFNTIMKTPDNKTIFIPNGGLSTSSIVNFSTEPTRRVDWTFGISYGDDMSLAREILTELINEDERILKDPPPFIAVSELADSSVNIVVRVWAKSGDVWPIFFSMNEKVYNLFPERGLTIPFPQMDVHVQGEEK